MTQVFCASLAFPGHFFVFCMICWLFRNFNAYDILLTTEAALVIWDV